MTDHDREYSEALTETAKRESRNILSELHGVYEFEDRATGSRAYGWYCQNCDQMRDTTWAGGRGQYAPSYIDAGRARVGLFTHRPNCPAIIVISGAEQRQIGAVVQRARAARHSYSDPLRLTPDELIILGRIAERQPAMQGEITNA